MHAFMISFVASMTLVCGCVVETEDPGPETEASDAWIHPDDGAESDVAEAHQELCSPSVTSVWPKTAYLNQYTTFTVNGSCLPQSTAFWIAYCENVQPVGITSSKAVFSCTPKWYTGTMSGVVKNQPGGTTLKLFEVLVM